MLNKTNKNSIPTYTSSKINNYYTCSNYLTLKTLFLSKKQMCKVILKTKHNFRAKLYKLKVVFLRLEYKTKTEMNVWL